MPCMKSMWVVVFLCAATTTIEEKTLFPSDITKRMKEITDASKINRQLTSFPRNGPKNLRGKMTNFRGRRPQYLNTTPISEAAADVLAIK